MRINSSFAKAIGGIALTLITAGFSEAKNPELSFRDIGLGGLEVCDDAQGMRVRGQSSRSYSMGVASLSVLIYDPATGSQTNIDIAHFSNSESSAMVSDPTSAAVEGVVGFTGLGIEIGGFRANLSQGALFFGGQTATQGNFSVHSLNVPRFR
jgi:hypothetical protein